MICGLDDHRPWKKVGKALGLDRQLMNVMSMDGTSTYTYTYTYGFFGKTSWWFMVIPRDFRCSGKHRVIPVVFIDICNIWGAFGISKKHQLVFRMFEIHWFAWGFHQCQASWWLGHPSEKYDLVNWDDCSQVIWENKTWQPVPTKQQDKMRSPPIMGTSIDLPSHVTFVDLNMTGSSMFILQLVERNIGYFTNMFTHNIYIFCK